MAEIKGGDAPSTVITGNVQNTYFASASDLRPRIHAALENLTNAIRRTESTRNEFDSAMQSRGGFIAHERAAIADVGDSIALLGSFVEELILILQEENVRIEKNSSIGLVDAIDRLTEPLIRTRVAIEQGGAERLTEQLSARIIESATQIDKQLIEVVAECRSSIGSSNQEATRRLQELADHIVETLTKRELLDETRAARDEAVKVQGEAQQALEAAREAAGETGSTALAHHYSLYADFEQAAATRFRLAAIGIVLIVGGLAIVFTFRTPDSVQWSPRDVVKLAAAVPLAVLAAYLGRESSRHRERSAQARRTEIQLKTLPAFIAPLERSQQDELRRELGRKVFGDESRPISVDPGPSIAHEMGELAGRLAEAAKALRGGSTTPPSV